METKKRITFVVNPISGTHGKEFILRLIEKELNHSIYDYSIRKTEYAGHASEIAAQAAAEHTDIVVAIGGDGTINEIGRALIHTNTAMGIFHVVRETDLHAICIYLWNRKGPSMCSMLEM